MDTPKNIFVALVKREDIEKDKNKRVIKETAEWIEVKDYTKGYILIEKEIFQIIEVQHTTTKKNNGLLKSEYWEINYSGVVGLAKGKSRRVYNLHHLSYEKLKKYRFAFLEMVDEFEKWGLYERKKHSYT